MPYVPPPELASLSLAEIAQAVAERKLPPVESWEPQRSGDSEMRIARDGRWFHRGGEITRPAMVRAFAGLLSRHDNGVHWLVTPFEKLRIEVDDAAFVATDMIADRDQSGVEHVVFRLNTDEFVIAGTEHPLRASGSPDTPALYVAVRRGCEARLNRSTYVQLVEHALAAGDQDLALSSGGTRFALAPPP